MEEKKNSFGRDLVDAMVISLITMVVFGVCGWRIGYVVLTLLFLIVFRNGG